MSATPTPEPGSHAAQTMALRKAYAISLYCVDCLRVGMSELPELTRQDYLVGCMESLADIQECIQGVFPNDKSLGD